MRKIFNAKAIVIFALSLFITLAIRRFIFIPDSNLLIVGATFFLVYFVLTLLTLVTRIWTERSRGTK
ncbi:MAG: hypothetical protein K2G40_01595 [Muribaculaceae bacterium]|nr:hypothetical protein [Muribaculaceae bacterium]